MRYEDYGQFTAIEIDTLTDGSETFNVIYSQGGVDSYRFLCCSERDAHALADALEKTCGIENLTEAEQRYAMEHTS